ncbi:MAG: FAD-dependent oxidoreductase [Clostridia bacterium]|nr:FAD-dependent oxidoreductase [Clostridia bacterium]
MDSVWRATTKQTGFPPLKQNQKTDVLIIGGGMAGVLCAYRLGQAGIPYILVEADKIGGGITKNTTAKITAQHGLIYDKITRQFDRDTARLYYEAQTRALQQYKHLCADIPCDFEQQHAFIYSLDAPAKIEAEINALQAIGCDTSFVKQLPLPFSVAGAAKMPNQAQFHPLKFLFHIAADCHIYEHTKVLEFTPNGVLTNRGTIEADAIFVTTHFPLLNKHGGYFLKLYQHRSYVTAFENTPPMQGVYADASDKGFSFRRYDRFLLLGGGGHRTGKSGGNWREIADFAQKHYPQARAVHSWATQDCMTLDGMPYIGQYSKRTPNLYVATGFNKWGMTSSMVAATILCDLVQGKDNIYAPVFSPARSILRRQTAINAAESLIHLLTPTTPRCPHLGCALKYNQAEHSWDCPCHGSRFTTDGTLIDNPATDDKAGLAKKTQQDL